MKDRTKKMRQLVENLTGLVDRERRLLQGFEEVLKKHAESMPVKYIVHATRNRN